MTMSVIEKKRIESRELVKVVENIIEDIESVLFHSESIKMDQVVTF